MSIEYTVSSFWIGFPKKNTYYAPCILKLNYLYFLRSLEKEFSIQIKDETFFLKSREIKSLFITVLHLVFIK